jgi:glutamate synthase domain-containing protein 3
MKIDASQLHYKELNQKIRAAVHRGETDFELVGVNGHRYLADGLEGPIRLHVHGTPGQDLGAFMNGPEVWVHGNAQDGAGNTMDAGRIIVAGMAGDVAGYGMRGGEIFIRGDAGYRVGIHMKSYQEKVPTIVIGGKAGDFLGEYMAGGCIILLGLFSADHLDRPLCGNYLGTGMHGGVIYVRGTVEPFRLGRGLTATQPTAEDQPALERHVLTFAELFDLDGDEILGGAFTKVVPATHRPYGSMYAY